MNSPFIFGTTVSEKSFTNREKEVSKLYNNLCQGINTTIISPRRWGKSSLVEKVIRDIDMNEPRIKTVIIDLFTIGSEEEFYEVFAREVIKASSSTWQDWLRSGKEFFKQLVPKLSIGIDPANDFSLSFDWTELKKHRDEILNLPETIGTKNNIRFIICLDEFQNLSHFKNYELLEKRMRACWQRQKKVSYCLYGSKRHMMAGIFDNASKPFYRFGDIMFLPKIQTEKWTSFIHNSFKTTGKSISKTNAEYLALSMKQHSWYVQQLAHYVWQQTSKKAGKNEINMALTELLAANSPLYQKEAEIMSVTQLNLLKAIIQGETKLTAVKTMKNYRLGTPRNVSKNKAKFINNDIIHKVNDRYELLDPAFELWFKEQFFDRKYSLKT
ncbi:AAA family ATPase [Lutimonas sp.]|uniref:AAA family ATPase n=1 Tax=Lutimonas sp. TaxID=1872403 RepID=UPI003D9B162A